MIAYRKSNGTVTDLRAVADGYVAQAGETLIAGDELPDPASLLTPAEALGNAKAAAHARISAARDDAIAAGIAWNSHSWQADDRSRALLTGAVAAFQAGVPIPQGFTWRTADNQDVPMAMADLVGLAAAMLQAADAAYSRSWKLKAQIDAAQSIAAIQAVGW